MNKDTPEWRARAGQRHRLRRGSILRRNEHAIRFKMNSLIELHDSTIATVNIRGEIVVVHFAPAYIHISKGRPGIDAGFGWIQEAKLTFLSAETQGLLPELPATLDDGELIVGEQRFPNSLPLPLDTFSAASLKLLFDRSIYFR